MIPSLRELRIPEEMSGALVAGDQIHVNVWQQQTQFCKAIILQSKNKNKTKN